MKRVGWLYECCLKDVFNALKKDEIGGGLAGGVYFTKTKKELLDGFSCSCELYTNKGRCNPIKISIDIKELK